MTKHRTGGGGYSSTPSTAQGCGPCIENSSPIILVCSAMRLSSNTLRYYLNSNESNCCAPIIPSFFINTFYIAAIAGVHPHAFFASQLLQRGTAVTTLVCCFGGGAVTPSWVAASSPCLGTLLGSPGCYRHTSLLAMLPWMC
jgi:hypothetical protein